MTTSRGRTVGKGRAAVGVGVAMALAMTATPPPSAARLVEAAPSPPDDVYTVVLAAPPAARYAGGGSGSGRVDGTVSSARSRQVRSYRQMITGRQQALLARIGGPPTLYRYTTALNGFTARLTAAQVQQLRTEESVLSVRPDRRVRPATTHTPRLLSLTGRRGVWSRNGGAARAGRGVVVGVLDTGIWPENPSFRGRPGVPRVPGFRGACRPGEAWSRATCGSKIVSARHFLRGVSQAPAGIADEDYLSPRDGDGHGSHTAAIAAGRAGVAVSVEGDRLGRASGMAPAAKIAVYKVLWKVRDPASGILSSEGAESDVVAAIDQAVRDGVDVLNLSGTSDPADPESFTDPVNLALMNAAAAGVFIAAAAGNFGPGRATVRNLAPWVTTAAASTTHLYRGGAVVLGDGRRYVGAMVSNRVVPQRRLVFAGDVPAAGAPAEQAALCAPGSLSVARVSGRIVVCDRGTYPRNLKSIEVRRAGGVGMVLVNVAPDESLDQDVHAVPTVQLDVRSGASVRGYARYGLARARLDPAARDRAAAPRIAEFSARGPAVAGGGDVLKPDLAAPGSSVLAAVAPPFKLGRRWELLSGTSMASAHVAGLAALIRSYRPRWSPMAVKSAMMTTASDVRGPRHPFLQGAGQVRPRRFLNPGLVLDSRVDEWQRFLAGQEGTTAPGVPAGTRPTDANALNLASIAIGDLDGSRTVTRRVRSVSGRGERYTVSSAGLPGITVRPRARRIWVGPGRVGTVRTTFVATSSARFGTFVAGRLVLRGDRGHRVRLPVTVRAIRPAAETVVPGSGTR